MRWVGPSASASARYDVEEWAVEEKDNEVVVTYSEWWFYWGGEGELPAELPVEEGTKVSYRVVMELVFPGECGPLFLDGTHIEKSAEALSAKRTVEKVLASLKRYADFNLGLVKWWEWEEEECREYEEVEEKVGVT